MLAVVCNCGLVMMTGGVFYDTIMSTRVLYFVALEHLLFFTKSFFGVIVADEPREVTMQCERQEFISSKIIKDRRDEELEGEEEEDEMVGDEPDIENEDLDEVYHVIPKESGGGGGEGKAD